MRRSAKIAVGIILYALLLFVMIFPFFYNDYVIVQA